MGGEEAVRPQDYEKSGKPDNVMPDGEKMFELAEQLRMLREQKEAAERQKALRLVEA